MIVYHGSNVEVREPRMLKVKTLYNQLVFASTLALSFLRYRKSEVFHE